MSDRTCEQMEDLLVDYADNELPSDQRPPVEAHLADCPHCRVILQALQQSTALVGAVWNDAYQGVADLQPADVVPQRRRRWIAFGGVAIAAAIALALLAVLTGRVLVSPVPPARPEPLLAAAPPVNP